jgi:site-specific recombinase XerC
MKLAGEKQLHTPLPDLKLFSHHVIDKVYTKDGSNLPFITWPDGTPCTPANLYMLKLRDTDNGRGGLLSRRGNKGGTIGDYAGKISQLIRFCFNVRKTFLELNDSDFTKFMSDVRMQRYKDNIKQRQKNSETTNHTGQVCLRFLQFLGLYSNQPNFVAPLGIINISLRWSARVGRNGKMYKTESIHHHSFSIGGDAGDTRNPISDSSIQLLRSAVDSAKTSDFLKSRRHLQMSFLEYAGPRRGELAEVTIAAINEAFAMEEPMLTMTTLKKGVPSIRKIPVSKMLLGEARKHVKFYRRDIISKYTITGKSDHDFLFISETTGKPLLETTTTNEINKLAKAAHIREQACPHMFRHAFCTNLFVILFERHKLRSDKEFEIRLLSDEAFLGEVKQYSGHSDLEILRGYIKTAYARINKIPETVSIVQLAMLQQQFESHLLRLLTELDNGLDPHEFSSRARQLIANKNIDFSNATKIGE